jgi:hypothetical protein
MVWQSLHTGRVAFLCASVHFQAGTLVFGVRSSQLATLDEQMVAHLGYRGKVCVIECDVVPSGHFISGQADRSLEDTKKGIYILQLVVRYDSSQMLCPLL